MFLRIHCLVLFGHSRFGFWSPLKGAIVGGIKWPKLYQKVLGRERNGGVVEKLELSDDFCHLSGEFCDELNHDFLKLFESAIFNSVGRLLEADTEKDFDKERLIEEGKKVILEEQKRLMIKEERALEVKKRWDEDYRKRSYTFMNSDHMKKAMARCAPKKRTEFVTIRTDSWLQVCKVCVDRRFWESLVCLDPTRKGWLMDEHIDLWVDYMWHVRPHDAKWAMVSSYFVQLLLQNEMPLWYVNGESYSIALTKANKLHFMIVVTVTMWNVVICTSGQGTAYRENVYDFVQGRLPEVLELVNVFDKKGIDKSTYNVTFRIAENMPKQRVALAYRERIAQFYYNHKVV
ncbi:hypothetical protein Tco_1310748 [Tanacetum coccineum]